MPKRKERKPEAEGRPVSRKIKLDTTPEEVVRRIFENARLVDPTLRRGKMYESEWT